MASHFRRTISKLLVEILEPHVEKNYVNELHEKIRHNLRLFPKKGVAGEFRFDLDQLRNSGIPVSSFSSQAILEKLRKLKFSDDIHDIIPVNDNRDILAFVFNSARLIEEVLNSATEGKPSELKQSYLLEDNLKKNIIVEYGSPNIAKPFHAGHLRSTIIGNVLSNLKESLGHKVTRINYLGDWGTQFGLLQVGFLKYGNENILKETPISHLYDIYVKINKDLNNEPELFDQAKFVFEAMENGDQRLLEYWKKFRLASLEEYQSVYERIGVRFDHYHGESMYNKQSCKSILEELKKLNLLLEIEASGQQGVKLTQCGRDMICPLIKSDGSLLYLTRDIVAAFDRKKLYDFDEMLYVVESGQNSHFQSLLGIIQKMEYDWSRDLKHVKFGRIHGMSSRKGTAVFLRDIFDEAKAQALKGINDSPTTKVPREERENVADTLGVGAVIINDLRSARCADYKFSWNRALHQKGDSGISLQYAHARMVNLEKNCGTELVKNVDHTLLDEPEALFLVQQLARYVEVLLESSVKLEPCVLIQYLFQLSHAINAANKKLTVKGSERRVSEARLKLFHVARIVLADGMKVVGLKPLERI